MGLLIWTWAMAAKGVEAGAALLAKGAPPGEAVETAVALTEDNPAFVSVGLGGLPNSQGIVELDAAFMEGNTLRFGGIMAVRQIANPIRVARSLSRLSRNTLLAGVGAEEYAAQMGFPFRNMLTEASRKRWAEKLAEDFDRQHTEAYEGHDTVCVLGVDGGGQMADGVSTSGLFMKHAGRVGDSPIIGSGLYCDDAHGAAAATGVGEDIMRGCLSYEIVRLLQEGLLPVKACQTALYTHEKKLLQKGGTPGSMSVIALCPDGRWGAATTKPLFPVAVADEENPAATLYLCRGHSRESGIEEASPDWIADYKERLKNGLSE